jgi:hypothetical protein
MAIGGASSSTGGTPMDVELIGQKADYKQKKNQKERNKKEDRLTKLRQQ